MSNTLLILGESGSGKSTSIRNLDPVETFIINVIDKPLPFRGFKKNYIKMVGDGSTGNYYASDDYHRIKQVIKTINEKRPDVKTLIIDDWQYTMGNEFMRRATERGYDKFTEIGQHAWQIVRDMTACRDDLTCYVMCHTDIDAGGKVKCKTIGKMLDDKISIEGMFTVIMHTMVMDGKYKFLTQNDGTHIARSPMDMFRDQYIDNDLLIVKKAMNDYFNSEVAA